MSERKHPLARCEDCDLLQYGRFVPSDGPAQASIAFVGEAPGRDEALSGRPFMGASGKLLNTIMKHHSISREESLMTNACLCRPPDNATPTKMAINACQPRLLAELEDRGVETVVLLGNSAAQSVLGQSGITRLRIGPAKDSPRLPGVRVIPTIHPAAALRQSDNFPYIVTDIGKVNLHHGVWNPPTYVVLDSVSDALRGIDELRNRPDVTELVIDIEVDIEKDTAFDHPNHYGMLCVGVAYAKSKVAIFTGSVLAEEQVRTRLGELFRNKRLCAQNGKFDLAGLYPVLGGLELNFDTMLASYVFDERKGIHSLDYQGREYLGTPDWKHELDKHKGPGDGYGVIPPDVLYKYCAYDCSVTWDLKEVYEERFKAHPDLRKVHDFLVDVSNQLMYVELNGIAVDKEYLKVLEGEYLERLADLEEGLNEILHTSAFDVKTYDKFGGINPRSPLQVKKYLADRGVQVPGTDVEMLTKVQDKLASMKETEHEVYRFVSLLLRHRREAKLYGTYVKGIRKRLYGGRVFPSFLLHGTTTGRPACRNPNLLNIPRESTIRKLFVPAHPENVFLQTDYAQAELRVLSFLASDTYFRDIFNEGIRDVFEELTAVLYPGVTKEMVGAAKWKDMRVRVKAFVYGLSYGRTAYSIAAEFGLPLSEAKILETRFKNVIPEIVKFQADTQAAVLGGNDLVTPWGRRRRYMLVTKENWEDIKKEALAFKPQSTANDMCLLAFTWSREQLKGIAHIRNVIYDAILAETHESQVLKVQEVIEYNMIKAAESIVGDYVKFKVETDIGRSWAEC